MRVYVLRDDNKKEPFAVVKKSERVFDTTSDIYSAVFDEYQVISANCDFTQLPFAVDGHSAILEFTFPSNETQKTTIVHITESTLYGV